MRAWRKREEDARRIAGALGPDDRKRVMDLVENAIKLSDRAFAVQEKLKRSERDVERAEKAAIGGAESHAEKELNAAKVPLRDAEARYRVAKDDLKKAESDSTNTITAKVITILGVGRGAKEARENLDAASARVEAARKAVKQAERALDEVPDASSAASSAALEAYSQADTEAYETLKLACDAWGIAEKELKGAISNA